MRSFRNYSNRRGVIALLLAVLFAVPAFAQTITVQGTVIDGSTGEPIIGANVIAKGSVAGAATDFEGKFTISAAKDAVLQVSYIGYESQEVAIEGRTSITVRLKESSVVLDEVVAIGYGTVKKSDATGSVSMLKPDEIEAGLATSAQDLLVGKSPGVVVTQDTGDPQAGATIRIRGGASLKAKNDPLIVIDGVPMDNSTVQGMSNPLAMVSPDNIESMSILKDASATAIYGSRASNGVIIITTKKGKAGKPQVNFSANMYVNTPRNKVDVLSGDEFRSLITNYFGADAAATRALGTANTKWQDEVLRTSVSHDYNLSVGGTAGFLPYRVSVNYTQNNGIAKNSSMDRLTAGINLTPKFFDDHLSVQLNVKGYYFHNQFTDGGGAVAAAIGMDPTMPVMTDYNMSDNSVGKMYNGYSVIHNNGALEDDATQNPVAMINDIDNWAHVLRSNGNLQLDYSFHFLPDLHANLNLGYDWSRTKEHKNYLENTQSAWRSYAKDGSAVGLYTWEMKQNTLLDFYLNYKKEVESIESSFDVMAGYSWQHFKNRGWNNEGIFMSDGYQIPTYDSATGQYTLLRDTNSHIGQTFENKSVIPWIKELQLMSFFGRFNYSFKDTYLLTFTLRDDASSRFSKDNRWGLFPSVALAWKIDNMPFFKKAKDVMNDFKLRLGWGITGQQDLGDDNYWPYLAVYKLALQGSYYPITDANGNVNWSTTLYPGGYDPNIKWEETTTWNVGVDMGFLNNRITASLDWYLRESKDLLAHVTVPVGGATTNELDINVGTLRNIGLEFSIEARPIVTKDFTWTIGYNVAWNKNEITKLNNSDDPNSVVNTGDIPGPTGSTGQVHKVGYPAYSFYLYEQVYDADGKPIEGEYVDQNGDGQINDDDRVLRHQKDPKVTMTMSNNFKWKNWDLGFTLRANLGNYVYNGVLAAHSYMSNAYSYGLSNMVKNDFYFDQQQHLSDYYLRNASFLRCDNITLGYTWENLLKNKLRLRLFAAVQNPFVITKYNGLDPEIFNGIDNNSYPRPTTYSLGLVANF